MLLLIALATLAPAARADDRAWTQRALALQYDLASDVGLRNVPWVYTHNSFNSKAEMGTTLSDSDPNQELSLVDQLNEGVRHLEIDVHLFPSPTDPRVGASGPVVCHATGPAAGCSVEKPLVVVLREVRGWMRAHPTQVVMIYLESHLDTAAGYEAGAAEVREALGGTVYSPPSRGARCDPIPLSLTRAGILKSGKQVLLIGPCGLGSGWPGQVFDESRRLTGSSNAGLRPFPDCGPDFTRKQYDAFPIRYYEDGTQLGTVSGSGGDPIQAPTARRMIRCGVDIIGFDHLSRGDPRLSALVWSWAPGEPGRFGSCALQRPDGRFESHSCKTRLRVACRTDGGRWKVPKGFVRARAEPRLCARRRYRNAVPRTGYEGQLLAQAAARAGAGSVWVGYRRRGSGWTRVEKRGCGPSLRRARHRWPVRHGVARFVVRLRFACTRERLRRGLIVGGGHGLRARTSHRVHVRVGRHRRSLKVRFRYKGKRHAVRVLLRHRR